MANIQWQAEDDADHPGRAEHAAKQEIAHDAAELFLDIVAQPRCPFAPEQAAQPAQQADALANFGIRCLVFKIAGNQAGKIEIKTGNRSMRNGPAQGVKVGQQVRRLAGFNNRFTGQQAETKSDGDGDWQGDHDIAGNCCELAAADGSDDIDQALQVGVAGRFEIAEQAGQGLCGHRRLFGCDGHAEQVDQDETQTVNHAEQKGFDKERRVQSGGKNFKQRHAADQYAGTGCRAPHLAIIGVAFANVVFTGTSGVFCNANSEQLGKLAHVVAQAVTAVFGNECRTGEFGPCGNCVFACCFYICRNQNGDQIDQPLQALFASGQNVRKVQAGTHNAGPFANLLQGF